MVRFHHLRRRFSRSCSLQVFDIRQLKLAPCFPLGAPLPAIPSFLLIVLGGIPFFYLFGICGFVGTSLVTAWLLSSLAMVGSSSKAESSGVARLGEVEWEMGNSSLGAASDLSAKLWLPTSAAWAVASLQVVSPLARGSLAAKVVEIKDVIRRVLGRKRAPITPRPMALGFPAPTSSARAIMEAHRSSGCPPLVLVSMAWLAWAVASPGRTAWLMLLLLA